MRETLLREGNEEDCAGKIADEEGTRWEKRESERK